jgi:uncharacterized protein
MRLVLLLVVVGIILWLLSARSRARSSSKNSNRATPETFARCAHCGVHLPLRDALLDGSVAYCSEAHRLAGPTDRGTS